MTNVLRLSVIALLTGTLAIVGCGDDDSGTGGTAGSGGGGGTAGSGGGTAGTGGGTAGTGGGTAGTGGTGGACEQTCGAENPDPPDGAPEGSSVLSCEVMGIGVDLTVILAAAADGDLMDGDNDITVFTQTVIPTSVVDLIILIAESATITDLQGTVLTTGEPDMTTIGLSEVPCEVCFETGVEVIVNIDPTMGTFVVEGGMITFVLEEVVVSIDAGLVLILSNVPQEGQPEPLCAWEGDMPPEVTLTAPM